MEDSEWQGTRWDRDIVVVIVNGGGGDVVGEKRWKKLPPEDPGWSTQKDFTSTTVG